MPRTFTAAVAAFTLAITGLGGPVIANQSNTTMYFSGTHPVACTVAFPGGEDPAMPGNRLSDGSCALEAHLKVSFKGDNIEGRVIWPDMTKETFVGELSLEEFREGGSFAIFSRIGINPEAAAEQTVNIIVTNDEIMIVKFLGGMPLTENTSITPTKETRPRIRPDKEG